MKIWGIACRVRSCFFESLEVLYCNILLRYLILLEFSFGFKYVILGCYYKKKIGDWNLKIIDEKKKWVLIL